MRLASAVDLSFDPGAGANGAVLSLAVQADDSVLVGGSFTEFNGKPRSGIARLHPDGGLDMNFVVSPDLVSTVSSMALQADGRVLLASAVPGPGGAYLVRVNPDGSADGSFAATVNGAIHAVTVDSGGMIWLGGQFTEVNGLPRNRVARLGASGAVDMSFDPGDGPNAAVFALLPEAGGGALLGGSFYRVGQSNVGKVVRLRSDGSLDDAFRTQIGFDYFGQASTNFMVRSLATGTDGKIIAGGSFVYQYGPGYPTLVGLAQLFTNGAVDVFFSASLRTIGSTVHSVMTQSNGRIIVGGDFLTFNGMSRPYLVRLHPDGSLDDCFIGSSNASPNGVVRALGRQMNGGIIAAGDFTSVAGEPHSSVARFDGSEPPLAPPTVELTPIHGWPRAVIGGIQTRFDAVATSCHGWLGYQWFFNGVALAGERFSSLAVFNQTASGAGYYSVVVSNSAGMATSSVVRLDVGMQNFDFNTTNGPFRWSGAPVLSSVWSVLPLRNGQLLVGGPFEQVEGLDWRHLARLNPDGSLDRTFTARPNQPVRAMIEQPDGRILIAGEFNAVNGQFRDRVARLEPDGSLDTNFPVRLGLNGIMRALALQPDGKVIVGGAFHIARDDAPWIHNIIRLGTNGLIDFTFDPGTNLYTANIASNFVRTVAVLPDGKIMAGGTFNRAARSGRDYLARLLSNGALDPDFGVEPLTGPNGPVYSMALQAGGLLTIGGNFTNVHGVARTNLARLLPDGLLDETFFPQAIQGGFLVNSLAVDAGGRVLAVYSSPENDGNFSNSRVFRFDAAGRIESNQMNGFVFRGGNYAGISTLALNNDGGAFIGGTFDIIDGVTRRRVALLLGDPPGPPAFSVGPTSQTVEATQNLLLSASVSLSTTTSFQWFQNGEALPAGTNAFLLRSELSLSVSGDYWLVASNRFGASTSSVATVTVLESGRPGSVDLSFAARPGANSNVLALAEIADGRIFVGGRFTRFHGSNVLQLVRLENSGAVDPGFTQQPSVNGGAAVNALLPRPDGSIIVASQPQNYLPTIRRYLSNGSSDPAWKFQATLYPTYFPSPGFPSKSPVIANLAEDEQGRIIAAGSFSRLYVSMLWVNRDIRYALRLFPDGTLDTGFKVRLEPQIYYELDDVYAMSLDPDGNALLGVHSSYPTSYAVRLGLFRLNANGQDDGSIDNWLDGPGHFYSLLVQPDGRVLASGYFSDVQGSPRPGLARLLPDGRLDSSFVPWAGAGAYELVLASQPGGRILVTAGSTNINGVPRNKLLRLNPDGSLDSTFNVGKGPDGYVGTALVRKDGTILVGGRFRYFSGFPCGNLALLHGGPPEAPGVPSQPQSVVMVAGNSLTLGPIVAGYPPPSLQWLKNGEPIPGATQSKFRLPGVRLRDAGDYLLVASNSSGISTTLVATVSVQPPPLRTGTVDPAFSAEAVTDGEVNTIVRQGDGRVLVGGNFTRIAGAPRAGIARLLADGALDTGFDPGTALSEMPSNNVFVSSIVLQPDGKVVVGGSFNRFNGVARRGVVRLNTDGTVDESLPDVGGWPLAVQPDGKLVMGGGFGNYLRRLHTDGTVDFTFTASTNLNRTISAAALLADGRMLVAGDFTGNIARLLPDGSQDESFDRSELLFDPGALNDICFPNPGGAIPQPLIHALCVQADGRILIGGVFRKFASPEQWNLARLLPSGRLDPGFNHQGGPNYAVRSIAVQPDGKILIGGCFTNLGYFPNLAARHHLARLNADGSVDPSFNPGAGFRGTSDGYVRALTLLPDGRLLLGGSFDVVDGVRRNNFARLTGEVVLFETANDSAFFTTRVATTEGRTYWLETRESADKDEWAVVSAVAGDGADQVLTDSVSSTGKRFYRVRVE